MKEVKKKKDENGSGFIFWIVFSIIVLMLLLFLGVFAVCVDAADGVFLWENAGGDSFGTRNGEKAIMEFFLPDKVKMNFIIALKSGSGKSYQMKKGEKFSQMIFGNYIIKDHVVVKIPQNQLGAEMYSIEFEGWAYYLICPTVCSNWAWRKEPVARKEKKIFFFSEPKSLGILGDKKELLEEGEEAQEQEVVIPQSRFYKNETMACLWAEDLSQGLGGRHNSFFARQVVGDSMFCEGISVSVNSWRGRGYSGTQWGAGPVIDFQKNDWRTVVSLKVGETGQKKISLLDIVSSRYPTFDFWGGLSLGKSKDAYIGSNIYLWRMENLKGGATFKLDRSSKTIGVFVADRHGVCKGTAELKKNNSGESVVGIIFDFYFSTN